MKVGEARNGYIYLKFQRNIDYLGSEAGHLLRSQIP